MYGHSFITIEYTKLKEQLGNTMNLFKTIPLTAAQLTNESFDAGFMVDPDTAVDPAFSVDPDFSVPDYDVMIPSDDEDIDPDFSVMPPVYPDRPFPDRPFPDRPFPDRPYPDRPYPDRPIYPPFVPTPMPCLFCNNDQWVRGAIRFLNAATGYNAFTIYIDNRPVYSNLNFPELTRYQQVSQGYHTFAVVGNGYTYVRKSMYIGDGMATIAIINSSTGLDLTLIADTTCPMSNANACFRVCNLAYYSGAVNVALGNIYFNSVRFKQATSFSSMMSGSYTVHVSRSARPETTLLTTTISMRPRRIYTLYVLNWNPSSDAIQTLMVEDRRN